MDEIYVTRRHTCSEYEGNKFLSNPEWNELYRLHEKPTDIIVQEYWRMKGYDPQNFPPEEYPCPGCEGTGVIEEEITLSEAIEILETRKWFTPESSRWKSS